MRPGESVRPGESFRLGCDECMIVFDLRIAPVSEWIEQYAQDDGPDDVRILAPFPCPFCQLSNLRVIHDRPFNAESN